MNGKRSSTEATATDSPQKINGENDAKLGTMNEREVSDYVPKNILLTGGAGEKFKLTVTMWDASSYSSVVYIMISFTDI